MEMHDLIGLVAVIMPFTIPLFIFWTKHQRRMAEMQVKATAEKAAQYATHNADLEERVRVLERIVTDKGYDVASQIEALRDARKVEALRYDDAIVKISKDAGIAQ
jgi:predicted ArsR family transcriptional regulator